MKQSLASVRICGMETQQFVPVQGQTGVLVSSASVHVTGALVGPTASAVIEVRALPDQTAGIESCLPTFSMAETAVRPIP